MCYFVGVSWLRWGRWKTRTPHGLTRTWRQKRLYEVLPMWPGLLGCLLYHQDHLQSRGTLLHRPGEGRCDEGDVFLLAIWLYCLSHKAYTEQHQMAMSLQVIWTSRLWAVWKQRSVVWRPLCSSSLTKPYLPLPNTAVILPSATQHTNF